MERTKLKRTRFGGEYGKMEKSYATLYNVSKYIPGCGHLIDRYQDVLTPTYKDDWPELSKEMDQLTAGSMNNWLITESPEVIVKTLLPIRLTMKLRSFLIRLRQLVNPEYRFYFDSDFKAIPRSFAIVNPFLIMSTKDKYSVLRKPIKIERGNTTLEIIGILMRAEDAQLIQALIILMRKNLEDITKDGIHFTTNAVEIAKILEKSNPYNKTTHQSIKEGLIRLRGCVLTLTNTKGQWIIGGILNKASKLDEDEIKIILDKDFIYVLDLGYLNLDPNIHLHSAPAAACVYRYLMNDQRFKQTKTLSKRSNRTIFEQSGLGGIDPERYSDSYVRDRLKTNFIRLQKFQVFDQLPVVGKEYTWIGKGEKELPEQTISPIMRRTKHKEKEMKCPHGYKFGEFGQHDDECGECRLDTECSERGEQLEE